MIDRLQGLLTNGDPLAEDVARELCPHLEGEARDAAERLATATAAFDFTDALVALATLIRPGGPLPRIPEA